MADYESLSPSVSFRKLATDDYQYEVAPFDASLKRLGGDFVPLLWLASPSRYYQDCKPTLQHSAFFGELETETINNILSSGEEYTGFNTDASTPQSLYFRLGAVAANLTHLFVEDWRLSGKAEAKQGSHKRFVVVRRKDFE